jgi:hypothetical protein
MRSISEKEGKVKKGNWCMIIDFNSFLYLHVEFLIALKLNSKYLITKNAI